MKVSLPILTKMVAMATSLEESEELKDRIDDLQTNTYHSFEEKIVKIGSVDLEIGLLWLKFRRKLEMHGKA